MDEYLSGRFRGAEKAYRNTAKKYGKDNVQVTGHSLGGSQAVQVGRKYGVEGIAFEPGSGVVGAFRRAREDIGNAASHKLLSGIHKVFGKTFSPEKRTTGVQIVGSAYNPKLPIGKDRYENLFHNAEYGISALFHLPGSKKRTWRKLSIKIIIPLRILCNDSTVHNAADNPPIGFVKRAQAAHGKRCIVAKLFDAHKFVKQDSVRLPTCI